MRRHFTRDQDLGELLANSGYDVGRKKVDVRIDGADGKPIFEMEGAEFPEGFSQQACDIVAGKYFRVKDGEGNREQSFFDVVDRMVDFWADALLDEGILDGEEKRDFRLEARHMIAHQMFAPNSPQWFNTGVSAAYGEPDLANYEGMWHWDPKKRDAVPTTEKDAAGYSQTSACFILGVEDRLLGEDSITDHYATETKLFKGGSGTGTNFSRLRGAGEPLSKGGTSSGVMSFLDGLDRNAGAIKSGGTTRRAAKMVILDIDHPEIEEFIDWKMKEERKAKALVAAGYDGSMGGEAYSTVSGQNSNNSVRVSAEFMQKVLNLENDPDATFALRARTDGSVVREVRVADLWHKIARAAWECADPGIQFDDRYNEWHTCPNAGRINATNPCSEYAFIDNSACNLASINVFAFYDRETGGFDFDGFRQAVEVGQLILEASIHGGHFPTKKIAQNSHAYRPTGLGLTNLASLFLAMGLPYDSDEARLVAGSLAAIMTGVSYQTSMEMARLIGPFDGYRDNADEMDAVLGRHYKSLSGLPDCGGFGREFREAAGEAWVWYRPGDPRIKETGYRNAQVTVMAPTGTISFAMDCLSTGIEPFYSHTLYKKCSDGSLMEIKNPLYDPELPADVLATANEISPDAHLAMMAAVQPFISGSISKTVNMPASATVKDVKETYLNAYRLGLKSVSIYRDGSKGVQPLSAKKEEGDGDTVMVLENYDPGSVKDFLERLKANAAVKPVCDQRPPERIRPNGIRSSRTHAAKIGEVELYITVGFYEDGRMSEFFASSDKDGTVVKGLLSGLSKAISYMLQYGIEPLTIAKMLRNQRYEPSGPVERHPYIKMADSISDLIARIIEMECGNYSRCHVWPEPKTTEEKTVTATQTEGKWTEDICPECGSIRMVQSGTCKTCADCGTTTGCA